MGVKVIKHFWEKINYKYIPLKRKVLTGIF